MQLPFTVDQFFDVFGDYNLTLWPVLAAFWVASVAAAVPLIGGRVMTTRLAALAAIQWAPERSSCSPSSGASLAEAPLRSSD